jgi:hypothetical protein
MMFFYEIEVAESHRRRGTGKRMVDELKAVCRVNDAMKMWVPTERANVAATRVFASTGAAAFGRGDEMTYTYPRQSFMSNTESGEGTDSSAEA